MCNLEIYEVWMKKQKTLSSKQKLQNDVNEINPRHLNLSQFLFYATKRHNKLHFSWHIVRELFKTLPARRFSLLVYGKHCKLMGCAGSLSPSPIAIPIFHSSELGCRSLRLSEFAAGGEGNWRDWRTRHPVSLNHSRGVLERAPISWPEP